MKASSNSAFTVNASVRGRLRMGQPLNSLVGFETFTVFQPTANTLAVQYVPEPSSVIMGVMGLLALVGFRWRRRNLK